MAICSVVIINWNSGTLVHEQLRALANEPELDMIVVDNGSTEPLPFESTEFPSVTFRHSPHNTGFAHACNWGSLSCKSDWMLFLNPDVSLSIEAIREWIHKAKRLKLDASSPESEDPRYSKPVPDFWSLLVEFSPFHRIFSPRNTGLTLIGGALLIRTSIFRTIGGFDERYFLWYEDSDLTIRLLKVGAVIGRVPVVWEHLGAGSFVKMDESIKKRIFFHSLDVFCRTHMNLAQRMVLSMVLRRFRSNQLLPPLTEGVTLVVPNLDSGILKRFFETNPAVFTHVDELVIVTSGLNSDELWEYRRVFPQVRFIMIKENIGFASTVNIGFRTARSRYIGTQNDDVESDASWIDLCKAVCTPQVGSVNPIIYKKNGAVESKGIRVLPIGKAVPIHDEKQALSSVVDATNAASVLYNHSALERVGLFDERFGSYLEDIDLSLRIQRAGFENIVETNTSVIHHGQLTSKRLSWRKNWMDVKNWWLVILKNYSFTSMLAHAPGIGMERLRNISGLLRAFLS